MRYILTLIFLFTALSVKSDNQLDSLLYVLDKTVKNKNYYTAERKKEILGLKQQLNNTAINQLSFDINGLIFSKYSSFQTDSAYKIALHRIQLAEVLGRDYDKAIAQMNLAEVLRTAGMFKETLEVLEELRENGFYKQNLNYYYSLYYSLYLLMIDYSLTDTDRKKYQLLAYNYRDTLLLHTTHNSFAYSTMISVKNLSQGNSDGALALAMQGVVMQDSVGYHPGIANHILSTIYKQKGDLEKEKYYLAESAIADLRTGVKEYISLHSLAMILYNEGEWDRAYLYVKCAMEDAIFCNAPLRTLEVSRMLPIINATYDIKSKQEKDRLFSALILIGILSIVFVITLIYAYRQVKILSQTRKDQKEMNVELKQMNANLNDVNNKLLDSNIVKEEYIGQMFNLCSSYINKLEDFRITVNRRIKTGQVEELGKLTSTTTLVDKELKAFYKEFDTIFLNIYPTFVREFNKLLKPESQIQPKDGDLLTTELRIFALVRLGINDSVKIAELLHYSPQTIYNYRLKIRNGLIVSRDEFREELQKIGRKVNT